MATRANEGKLLSMAKDECVRMATRNGHRLRAWRMADDGFAEADCSRCGNVYIAGLTDDGFLASGCRQGVGWCPDSEEMKAWLAIVEKGDSNNREPE